MSRQALVDSFTQAWSQVILLAPKLVAMVSVLVIGYVLARWVSSLIAVVSEKIGLQTAAEKSGLAKSMHDVGIRRSLPSIVGGLVFYFCAAHIERRKPCGEQRTNQLTADCRRQLGAFNIRGDAEDRIEQLVARAMLQASSTPRREPA